MIFTLALRNLFHDGIRFVGTLIGIGFSVFLVTVQLGIYTGFSRQITSMIDRAGADLWIVPKGIKSFEEASLLEDNDRHQALAVDGVAEAAPVVVGFTEWRKPDGEKATVVVIGSNILHGGLPPWHVVEGGLADLAAPDGVLIDRTYLKELGVGGRGDTAQVASRAVRVVALSQGIRAFTTTPYVFTLLDRAQRFFDLGPGDATHIIVRLAPGADIAAVQRQIAARLGGDSEVLTSAAFAARSRTHWLFSTGAGFALIAGAILGTLVGTVIVAQTLYASTKDHLNEFATLRAIGSTAGYIHKVILCQALISAAIGFSLAALVGLATMWFTIGAVLEVVVTGWLLTTLLALTVVMCAVSALAAIAKVTRIDPAMVFSR